MNLAVKLYETMPLDDENIIKGINGKIPATVIFGIDIAPDNTYTIMTNEEYQAYLVLIENELQEWKVIQEQT